MSKTIDSIKRSTLKDDVLYDRIAETYFYQKTHPKARKKKLSRSLKSLRPLLMPIFAMLAAAVVAGWFLVFMESHRSDSIRKSLPGCKVIKVLGGGIVNRDIVKNAEFGGNARSGSKFTRGSILFNNPKKYNWADLSFNFKFPIDISKRNLSMWLKGERGGEKIYVILRDDRNRSYRLSDICLSSEWKNEVIPLGSIKKDIDLSRITHLRMECAYVGESPKEAESSINMTIYLKDINMPKES